MVQLGLRNSGPVRIAAVVVQAVAQLLSIRMHIRIRVVTVSAIRWSTIAIRIKIRAGWFALDLRRLEHDVGTIEPGKRADLQLLDCADEREIAYEYAGAGPQMVVLGGRVAFER